MKPNLIWMPLNVFRSHSHSFSLHVMIVSDFLSSSNSCTSICQPFYCPISVEDQCISLPIPDDAKYLKAKKLIMAGVSLA